MSCTEIAGKIKKSDITNMDIIYGELWGVQKYIKLLYDCNKLLRGKRR